MLKENFAKKLSANNLILAMLHLKGESREEKMEIGIRESHALYEGGVDAVVIENYYGSYDDMEMMLKYFVKHFGDYTYGVNALDNDQLGFALAREYGAHFLQLDSVAGHLELKDDGSFHEMIQMERERTDAFLFGGVRFKYQPYKSGRTLEEDLNIGMTRCDGIVVTGEATGDATPMSKLKEFRQICGNQFPLLVGSGSTPENIEKLLEVANGAIVGSYFKDTYKDSGDVDKAHVMEFMSLVKGR
ncbi:MAG TPA: membrane biogenesis protein [Ruminiclostridium sp.]|mgnify:CR=1 FL=1|nr:membrane biogenesis protein [Ruminiclostridium sp.]